jgi:hypothetical protein
LAAARRISTGTSSVDWSADEAVPIEVVPPMMDAPRLLTVLTDAIGAAPAHAAQAALRPA